MIKTKEHFNIHKHTNNYSITKHQSSNHQEHHTHMHQDPYMKYEKANNQNGKNVCAKTELRNYGGGEDVLPGS